MMAKRENFDFETENKFNLNFDFFKNLTQKQKETILTITVGVIALIVIVVIGVVLLAGGNSGNGGNNGGGNNAGQNNSGTSGGSNDVVQGEITNFYIASVPFDTSYYIDEEANYDGLSIFVRSTGGGGRYVDYVDSPSDFKITGFDSSKVNEALTITVEYGGGTATFTVEIVEIPEVPPVLQSIYLDPMPQTTYTLEDAFVFNNARIVAVYSDGTTKSEYLLMSHIDGFGAIDSLGEHVIYIRYFDDNGGYAETTLTITIVESLD